VNGVKTCDLTISARERSKSTELKAKSTRDCVQKTRPSRRNCEVLSSKT
jgi:hypothetical protein